MTSLHDEPVSSHAPTATSRAGAGGTDEAVLLRRLRASAMVNAQLHAQLRNATAAPSPVASGGAAADPVRRGGVGDGWIEEVLDAGTTGVQPRLVATSDGATWLVEADLRRQVRAGQLVQALTGELGAPEALDKGSEEAFLRQPEGPAVEVLEAPSGAPFLVVAGARRDLRGVLVTYPVSEQAAAALAAGGELSLGGAPQRGSASQGDRGASLRTSPLARQARRARRLLRRVVRKARRVLEG